MVIMEMVVAVADDLVVVVDLGTRRQIVPALVVVVHLRKDWRQILSNQS